MEEYYKNQLLETTALCHPTHHKGLGGIIAIAASIAIPYAAPAIASSMMLSAAATGVMSGLIGGAMGAGIALATGGDPLMGAVGGAFSAGMAGFAADPGSVAGGFRPGGTGGPMGGTNYYAAVQPSSVAGVGASVPAQTGSAGLTTPISPTYGPGWLSGGPYPAAGPTVGIEPSSAGLALSGGGTPTSAAVVPPPSEPGFFESLLDRAVSSDSLKQGAAKFLTTAIGPKVVGDTPDMSDEEQRALAQLNAARARQERLLGEKELISNEFLQQARNLNPDNFARQALAQEQNRLARAQQAGLRAVPSRLGGARLATIRRNALDTSRLGAYDRARNEANRRRLQLTASAANALPTGSEISGDYASDLAAADERYKRLAGAGQEFRDIFEPIAQDIFSS
jgi:hypothetical protein